MSLVNKESIDITTALLIFYSPKFIILYNHDIILLFYGYIKL